MDKNPAYLIQQPKIPYKAPVALSKEEAQQLLSAANSGSYCRSTFTKLRNLAIVRLFINCGLRRNELISLCADDVNLETGKILVHGKGNKERIVYMNSNTKTALQDYLQHIPKPLNISGKLFITQTGRPMQNAEINDLFSTLYKYAGLNDKNYGVHTLRKTCATLMHQNKVDLKTIRDILGHSDIKTTMHYIGISESDKQNAGAQDFIS